MPPRTGAEPAERLASATTPRLARVRQVAALVAGLVLLGLLVWWAGVAEVLGQLRALGWRAPLILVPFMLVNVLDTFGWRRTLPPADARRVPFWSLYLTRMGGEAVNSLTPMGAVGGEPVKAHLLRGLGVGGSDAVASVVIARTALTVAQVIFILIGLAALLHRMEQGLAGALLVAALAAVTVVFTRLLVRMQRRGLASTAWRWLRRIAPHARFVRRLEPRVHEIDTRLADFYHLERHAFRAALLWNLAGWLVGTFEVWLFMRLVNAPIGIRDALVVEALSQPIRAVAVIIPGGLGTQEVGGVALCTLLGMSRPAAVALWLLKRAREVAFDAIGLVYLTRRTARRR